MLPDPAPATVFPRVAELRKEDYSPIVPEATYIPPAPLDLRQTPRKSLKKSSLKMDQEANEAVLPVKKKGCNPKQSTLVGKNLDHITGVRFCPGSRQHISIDENRLLVVQLCESCKICTCK